MHLEELNLYNHIYKVRDLIGPDYIKKNKMFFKSSILRLNSCKMSAVSVPPRDKYLLPLCVPWNNGKDLMKVLSFLLQEAKIPIFDSSTTQAQLQSTNLIRNAYGGSYTLVCHPETKIPRDGFIDKAIARHGDRFLSSRDIPVNALFFIAGSPIYVSYSIESNRCGAFIIPENIIRIELK